MKEMIPTICKNKLPKGLSYAIGAKAISEALEGIGLYSNLDLSFHDNPFITQSEFTSNIKESGVLPVLKLNYSHLRIQQTSNMMAEMGWAGERWSISLYPIPSEYKKQAQEYLMLTGLPKLKKWLSTSKPETWHESRHCYSISFNLGSQECSKGVE